MYLENNFKKIKNIFPSDIYHKYQRHFKYIANKEKENIGYEKPLDRIDGINFYNKYSTLYNYLNYFSDLNNIRKISIKNKSFLEDLSKLFNLKSGDTKKGENNIEKAYDDLVLSNKKMMIFFIKK